MNDALLIILLLFAVAILYASVGHGGASGYIAVLAFMGVATVMVRPAALVMNVFVSGISFYNFYQAGYFKWKLFYPFIILSVPMAYLGSFLELDPTLYKRILGVCLLFAVARIVISYRKNTLNPTKEIPLIHGLWIGALLGLVSGMIGIGGGIILSPIILLLHWGNLKETAAVSALFILINSLAGITGLVIQDVTWTNDLWYWIPTVILGGIIGGYYGAKISSNYFLKGLLAFVLLLASIKLIFVV